MEILAVLSARVVVFIPIEEVAAGGRLSVFALKKALVERYGFAKAPEKLEDFDESKGVEFLYGRWKDKEISRVIAFQRALVVETKSSTDDSLAVLEDLLELAAGLGWNRRTAAGERKAFTSQLVVKTDVRLDNLNPFLRVLSERISKSVSEHLRYPVSYETTQVAMGFDQAAIKLPITPFSIERRMDALFSENKYFSSAPLPTDEHVSLLRDCEEALSGKP